MLLPFNNQKSVKDIVDLKENIQKIKSELISIAISKKVIVNIPKEIIDNIFETRIIVLEDLFYKVEKEKEKYYVQIFDENVSEETFEIELTENIKLNKKIKIFNK